MRNIQYIHTLYSQKPAPTPESSCVPPAGSKPFVSVRCMAAACRSIGWRLHTYAVYARCGARRGRARRPRRRGAASHLDFRISACVTILCPSLHAHHHLESPSAMGCTCTNRVLPRQGVVAIWIWIAGYTKFRKSASLAGWLADWLTVIYRFFSEFRSVMHA
jgi:hypothetical protein